MSASQCILLHSESSHDNIVHLSLLMPYSLNSYLNDETASQKLLSTLSSVFNVTHVVYNAMI